MKKLFVLLLVLSLAVCLGVTALAVEEGGEFPVADGVEPAVYQIEASVDEEGFDYVYYGTHAFAVLVIENTGNQSVKIQDISLSGDDAALFHVKTWRTPDVIAANVTNDNTWFVQFRTWDNPVGTYRATVTVTYSDENGTITPVSVDVPFSVTVRKTLIPQPASKPYEYDYENETIKLVAGTPEDPVWGINDSLSETAAVAIGSGQSVTEYLDGDKDFYVFVMESDNYRSSLDDSSAEEAPWLPDLVPWYYKDENHRPAVPTETFGTTPEWINGQTQDGTITGLDSGKGYQYKLSGASSWTIVPSGTTEITGLSAGTYLVRYAGSNSSGVFPSESAAVTVGAEVEATRNLSIAADDIETTYGAQAWTRLKITNSGNSTATITSVTLSGEGAGIYDVLRWSDPSDTVAPGATNDTWFIRFKSAQTEAGTYHCTVTVTYDNGATATKEITAVVEKAFPPQPSQPPVIVDYEAETICVDSAVPVEPVWAISENRSEPGTAIGEGQSLTAWLDTEGGKDLYLFITESTNYLSSLERTPDEDNTWAFLERLERPAAPTGPRKQADESVDGRNDGCIAGVDDSMEYKLQGAESWTAISGTELTGLADGTYLVRYKAVADSSFASKAAVVTIERGEPPVWDVSISGGRYDTHYNAAWVSTFTVTNTGNMPLTNARLSVEGTDAEKMFRIFDNTADLAVGQSGEWTQSYVGQMNVGSYDLTLVVTADNNVRIEKEITFVISPNSQLPPEHHTLQYPWGQDWIAYEKCESSYGAPIQYSFDGGQTWITGTPDPEDPNRLIIRGLTPDTHYSVDFRFGPSPDGNYAPSEKYEGSASFGFTTLHAVTMTQGDGQTFYLGSEEDLLFVSCDKFSDFSYLYVYPKGADMSTVAPLEAEHYTAEEGSVRVTLKAEYLNSLPVGEYVIEIPCASRLGDGQALAGFYVKEAPAGGDSGGDEIVRTGDSRQAGLWIAVVIVCAAALTAAFVVRKKKKH